MSEPGRGSSAVGTARCVDARALALCFLALITVGCNHHGSENEKKAHEHRRGRRAPRQARAPRILTPVVQVDCGGSAVGSFTADAFYSGGNVHTTSHRISTRGVDDAGPAALYQSERYGDYTYTFNQLAPRAPHTLRLHFVETFWDSHGTRLFNVFVNGVQALKDFDIFVEGGAKRAVVRDVRTTANPNGQIIVQFVSVVDNAESAGIEILTANAAPAPAASASDDADDDDSNQGAKTAPR